MTGKCYWCDRGGTSVEALRELDEARISVRVAKWLTGGAGLLDIVFLAWWVTYVVAVMTGRQGLDDSVVALAFFTLMPVGLTVWAVTNLLTMLRRLRHRSYRYQDAVIGDAS